MIVVDEAHRFCPEKGQGESEASEAMISLATTGRKRGFCAVFATQRLGKLRKDASAELLNRLIGPTFEDIDLERAADLLSVTRADRQEFYHQMKLLEPGKFWALGRAISKDRIMVTAGPIQTTHPDVASGTYAQQAPPPTAKIKALLPKLADLPKQAEEKARTIADYKAKVRELEAKLKQQPKPTITADTLARVKKAGMDMTRSVFIDFLRSQMATDKANAAIVEKATKAFQAIRTGDAELRLKSINSVISFPNGSEIHFKSAAHVEPRGLKIKSAVVDELNDHRLDSDRYMMSMEGQKFGKAEKLMLNFLYANSEKAWTRQQVSWLIGYSPTSSSTDKTISSLVSGGWIKRTDGKLQAAQAAPPPGIEADLHFKLENIIRILGKCEKELFAVLQFGSDRSFSREELCSLSESNYSPGSSSTDKAISRLASLGLLTRKDGKLKISDEALELL